MTSSRKAAFNILLRVERESAYAADLLHSSLLDKLSAVDRNLTQEIVMGVLRWRSLLDSAFAGLVTKPLRKLDLEVLIALRMGAYQLAFLDRIPDHAVVNETVELVRKSGKSSATGLVNAVMRRMEPRRRELISTGRGLAHDFAHPEWLVSRWVAHFGQQRAERICGYDQRAPATVLRLSSAEDERPLLAEGFELAPGALIGDARIVISGGRTESELFGTGKVAIQDEGSQLVAALVGEGKRVLDCCAAPGGKTAALATRLPAAEIVAAELHPHRARVLRERAPQTNVEVITADARQLPFGADFDRVLADVPCSGTGTLARNPEIKWRLKPEDIFDLQTRQIDILKAALKHVTPGGRLLYSTCSLEQEEDEEVVAAALKDNPEFKLLPVKEELMKLKTAGILVWQDVDSLVSDNFLRTFPGIHPCDGFFAAVLQRA